jgi:hypothetical protein
VGAVPSYAGYFLRHCYGPAEAPMTRARRNRSPCLFCGNPATSGEHLWSDWMARLLHRDWHNSRSEIANNFSRVGAPFGEITRWSSQGATHRKKIRVVCAPCNNGWMNEIEKSARPYLEPAMKGEEVDFAPSAQRAVAEWVALKALVLEHDPTGGQSPTPVHSPADRRAFKLDRTIPDGLIVWICAAGGPSWHDSLTLASARMVVSPKGPTTEQLPAQGPDRNVQSLTWGMRNLLVHTLAVTYPPLWTRLKAAPPPGALKIWPVSPERLHWPPVEFLTDWTVEEYAGRLREYSRTLPRAG